LAPEVAEKLSAMQALVVKFLTSPDEEVKATLSKQLPAIKELVLGKDESGSKEERKPAASKEEKKPAKEPVDAPVEESATEKKAPRRKTRRDD
jgi:hypothetical protein